MPMLSAMLILVLISIVELVLGIGFLTLLSYPLQKVAWPAYRKQVVFVALGVLLVSPALAPYRP